MKLVLAEKPSVAQSIAKVLGANNRCDGYLEGNGYVVSWCVGHLVELFEPEGYDEKFSKWNYDDLGKVPMSKKEDFKPKTYTKQEIDVKTDSSNRVIPIPDILFEAILEERQKYEKNRKRRINDKHNPFF